MKDDQALLRRMSYPSTPMDTGDRSTSRGISGFRSEPEAQCNMADHLVAQRAPCANQSSIHIRYKLVLTDSISRRSVSSALSPICAIN